MSQKQSKIYDLVNNLQNPQKSSDQAQMDQQALQSSQLSVQNVPPRQRSGRRDGSSQNRMNNASMKNIVDKNADSGMS